MEQSPTYRDRINQLREAHGIGMKAAQRAIEVGQNRYGVDDRRGGLWVYADSLAVHIKGGIDARNEWNDRWVEMYIQHQDAKSAASPKP